MIATQDSVSRDPFARALETARRKLRETIERHPDALPVHAESWRRGYFPGMLWVLASDTGWWQDQAILYSKLLPAVDSDGVGFALLPSVCRWAEVTKDPVAEQILMQAAGPLVFRLGGQEPTVSSLVDAVLLFHASALSGDSGLRAVASSHALAARRLLLRGDGSLSADAYSARDQAWAIHAFGAVYRFTHDPRFLGAAENCAAYFLETLPADGLPEDVAAAAIAASALLQLSSLAADAAKARFYTLTARQLLTALADYDFQDAEAEYFLLDAISHRTPAVTQWAPVAPLNGVAHPVVNEPEAPAAPEPEPEPEPEEPELPKRKRVRALTFLLAPVIFFLLIDLIFFRSNFYTRFIEPDSSEGVFEGTYEHEKARVLPAGKKAVMVLGSSRIAEGFSAKRANILEPPKGGYFFINGAVAGAGPRCMYYLMRDLDPDRNRYKAIVMTIDDYTDPDDYEDLGDRIEDLHSVIARLRFTDIYSFMQSFTSRKNKWDVLYGGLLKSLTYQRDLQEFLDHPQHRMEKASLYRHDRWDWIYDYGGSEGSLAGTSIDWTTKAITFPPTMPQAQQDYLRPRMFNTAPQKDHHVRDYQVRWLSALADLYKNSKTRFIFIQAPRTPLPRPVSLAHWPWTTIDVLPKGRPWVTIVDVHTFENLERPELFSDYAHLNAEGQKLFSPALAATVKSILEPAPPAAAK